jgi:F-type H+-transporting ATPase subunit epsilon
VKTAEGETSVFVGGGALEVQPRKVTILADTAVRAHDLDEAAALAAKTRAEEALASSEDKIDQAHALAELAQAAAQLKLLEKLRKTRG